MHEEQLKHAFAIGVIDEQNHANFPACGTLTGSGCPVLMRCTGETSKLITVDGDEYKAPVAGAACGDRAPCTAENFPLISLAICSCTLSNASGQKCPH